MKLINNIFDNMDVWRHLPAYQLERRADIFFSIYLPDLLSHKYCLNIENLIPEFPIRIGTIDPKSDTNRSFKVDYLAKVSGTNSVILVELKTDQSSRRKQQDWYLERAKRVGMVKLLEGVRKIYQATKSKKKYQYLLSKLQDMGFITLDSSGTFRIVKTDYDIHIVYIQPYNPGGYDNVITFREASEIIGRHEDELSQRFSQSLLKWAEIKADEK